MSGPQTNIHFYLKAAVAGRSVRAALTTRDQGAARTGYGGDVAVSIFSWKEGKYSKQVHEAVKQHLPAAPTEGGPHLGPPRAARTARGDSGQTGGRYPCHEVSYHQLEYVSNS